MNTRKYLHSSIRDVLWSKRRKVLREPGLSSYEVVITNLVCTEIRSFELLPVHVVFHLGHRLSVERHFGDGLLNV